MTTVHRLACVALTVLAAAACGKSDAQSPPAAPKAAANNYKPLPITVAKAESRAVQRAVETVGSLVAWVETVVKTEQPGTVAKLLVDLGDSVTQGKILAEYDAREFQLAVEQSEADLLSEPPVGGARPGDGGVQRGIAPARPGRALRAAGRGGAQSVAGGVGEVRAGPHPGALPQGAHRPARRGQRAQRLQHRAGPAPGRAERAQPASRPGAHRRGPARLRSRRPPRRAGRGHRAARPARHHAQAARRHHHPRALRGPDRQAAPQSRRVREGEHAGVHAGGARSRSSTRGRCRSGSRPSSASGPALRALGGGLPGSDLRRPGHAASRPRWRCRRGASPSRAGWATPTTGSAPASSPRAWC